MTILVTGGAGFIGSNFVRCWLRDHDERLINLDRLTYAGDRINLAGLAQDAMHVFVEGDIADRALIDALLAEHRPRAILNFAAESHVDRSITGPLPFIQTNVLGTAQLLDAAYRHFQTLTESEQTGFRYLQISTDEVYGSLDPQAPPADERTPYAPNNPYAASKAGADHLVRAYFRTFGLPAIVTNCSNNFGPYQFVEKLIPLTISRALSSKPIPVYGDGLNVRDWIFVEDHCSAIMQVLAQGRPGETYNVGGSNEVQNIDLVMTICTILDSLKPDGAPHARHITYVTDRIGHDRRYALNSDKISNDLGWAARHTLDDAMRKTVSWYVDNPAWVAHMTSKTVAA